MHDRTPQKSGRLTPGRQTNPIAPGHARHWSGRLRQLVERDYRLMKLDESYRRLIDSELQTAGVELFPERLEGGR